MTNTMDRHIGRHHQYFSQQKQTKQKKINTTPVSQNTSNSGNQNILILMDSNREFVDFRELLSNEIVDRGQIVVIPCGNVRKAEVLMNSPKITDISKVLIHVGVNDIDDQHLEDAANNLVTIAKKFQEKYKMSKGNIQKVSQNNLSPNHLHDDRHLKRNRSAVAGVELLCSNIYRAFGLAPEPGTLTKSLRYTRRNNKYMKSSFPCSRRNKYQTYCDGKSNTARRTTIDLPRRLNNYLYLQQYVNNRNYMHTPTDRWYPLYQSCKMVSEV